ncbi:MAG: hypothetical protein SVV80_13290 [Planctomycetota bacterium]|nr:hypothetical protein [Planctomycetota bacterium]
MKKISRDAGDVDLRHQQQGISERFIVKQVRTASRCSLGLPFEGDVLLQDFYRQ